MVFYYNHIFFFPFFTLNDENRKRNPEYKKSHICKFLFFPDRRSWGKHGLSRTSVSNWFWISKKNYEVLAIIVRMKDLKYLTFSLAQMAQSNKNKNRPLYGGGKDPHFSFCCICDFLFLNMNFKFVGTFVYNMCLNL